MCVYAHKDGGGVHAHGPNPPLRCQRTVQIPGISIGVGQLTPLEATNVKDAVGLFFTG